MVESPDYTPLPPDVAARELKVLATVH